MSTSQSVQLTKPSGVVANFEFPPKGAALSYMAQHTRAAGPEGSNRLAHNRTPLKLATRLRSARGGNLHKVWSIPSPTRRNRNVVTRVKARAAEGADQLR